jgi:DNA-binding GntR family transcriptional regulator
LKEQELADRFGLSRAPIREALRLLESQGLAVIKEMRGARVARTDEDSFHETLLIREGLSSVVAELAAENNALEVRAAKERFLELTQELARKARDGAGTQVVYEGLRANTRMLGEITLSTRAQAILRGVGAGREAFQVYAIQTEARRIQATETWVGLAEAILAGDGPKAANMMRTLYRNSMDFMAEASAAEETSIKAKKRRAHGV